MQDEDRVRILHMIDAAEAIAQFVAGRSHDDLEKDRMLLFALAHAIEILGEAANKISPEARATAPQVPWAAIVAMRNRLIHGYFDINTTIVWKTATVEVPGLVSSAADTCRYRHLRSLRGSTVGVLGRQSGAGSPAVRLAGARSQEERAS